MSYETYHTQINLAPLVGEIMSHESLIGRMEIIRSCVGIHYWRLWVFASLSVSGQWVDTMFINIRKACKTLCVKVMTM